MLRILSLLKIILNRKKISISISNYKKPLGTANKKNWNEVLKKFSVMRYVDNTIVYYQRVREKFTISLFYSCAFFVFLHYEIMKNCSQTKQIACEVNRTPFEIEELKLNSQGVLTGLVSPV